MRSEALYQQVLVTVDSFSVTHRDFFDFEHDNNNHWRWLLRVSAHQFSIIVIVQFENCLFIWSSIDNNSFVSRESWEKCSCIDWSRWIESSETNSKMCTIKRSSVARVRAHSSVVLNDDIAPEMYAYCIRVGCAISHKQDLYSMFINQMNSSNYKAKPHHSCLYRHSCRHPIESRSSFTATSTGRYRFLSRLSSRTFHTSQF